MNILKALWRSIMPAAHPSKDTPSQYVVCPHCKAEYKNLTQFEQQHSEFEEGENALQMLYTCGRCTVQSLWFADTGDMLYITSYGMQMAQLREDIQAHFRSWNGHNGQVENLKCAIAALDANTRTLQAEKGWDRREYASIYKQGCAVDFILYALLLSGNFDICHDNIRKFSMHTPCTEVETYADRLRVNHSPVYYASLLERAAMQVVHLKDSLASAQNVEYIFVEPAVHQSASELFSIGMLMLQLQDKKQFHQLVYERLRHFVYTSA